ncbi:insulinase family protein [Actinoplanes oblitus]|uniref:Insulinase family protein n=1 Tax=Actinoplanes oblitus TaxID=3040509 RepID=A0ABY8WKZ8_9ACTN|nr:insulinase family protein [Actinoplanes oblitus]WIM97198.1 insulinase family protein [Actinoplanes oblitus]
MITTHQVSGVPVLLAPTTGAMHAGLAFRVGFADEPLAKRGITHLIEHLALHAFGVTDHHYNGATGTEYTYFHTRGTEADVVAFLNGVCAALRDLPMQRLEVEKEILRTEENGRAEGPAERLALWRHGARDFGMPAYPEWGLTGLTPDDLRAWVAHYFTTENAALWIAGPGVPAGLDLTLPRGVRRPAPAASSALPVRPASFAGPANVVAWNAAVPHRPAAAVFSGVLERTLFRSLRQDSGISYTVQSDVAVRGDGTAVVTAVADALPEKQAAVLGGFVDVLAAARLGRFDPADVAGVVNQRITELTSAEETGARLPAQVFNLLAGRPVEQLDRMLAGLRAVTPAEVAEVGRMAVADGLLMTPGRTTADWAGYTPAPEGSPAAAPGAVHPSLERPDLRLVAGEQGVSLVDGDSVATVWFDRCAAMLTWPDGARRLIGDDGVQVHLEPTLFAGGPAVVAALDSRVRPGLRAPMPPRDPSRVPSPRPAAQPVPSAPARPAGRAGSVALLVVLSLVIVLCGGLGVLMGADAVAEREDRAYAIGIAVVGLGFAVAAGFGVRGVLRRRRGNLTN